MKNFYYFLLLFAFALQSCFVGEDSNNKTVDNQQETVKPQNSFCNLKIENSQNKPKNISGDILNFSAVCDSVKLDSAIVLVAGKKIGIIDAQNPEIKYDTKNSTVGNIGVSAEFFYNGEKEFKSYNFIILSDIDPEYSNFKVVKTYKHDATAYTQGLVYDNGIFYESTGLYKQSSLRKVKVETGEILQSCPLPDDIFGEGLALIDNKLVQLSWRNQKGFVYDKETFNKISEFQLLTEGWGLSPYGDTLLLTDGTENLYFLEKNSFTVQKFIQVYDNNGPIKMLNETEVVGDVIYANIYQKDIIAVIDIKTGKVLKYINLAGILPTNLITQDTDVLNGIAYNEKTKNFYVTGKNWPLMFEIKID